MKYKPKEIKNSILFNQRLKVFKIEDKTASAIVLIGPRSSGKTSILKEISKFNMKCIDLDQELDIFLKNLGGLSTVINNKNWTIIERGINTIIKNLTTQKDNFIFAAPTGIFQYDIQGELAKIGPIIGILPGKTNKEAIDILIKRDLQRIHFIKQRKKKEVTLKMQKDKIKQDMLFAIQQIETNTQYLIRYENLRPKQIIENFFTFQH